MDTAAIIQELYQNDRINYLIKIKAPPGLKDDFKQEVFLVLLEMDKNKIIELHNNTGLIWYLSRVILNLASPKNKINKLYQDVPKKAINNYIHSLSLQGGSTSVANAVNFLSRKESGTAEDWHEAKIFEMYIEYRSYERVAEYFGLPYYHINNVVKKIKCELVKTIRNDN